jgi:hypothetical protein
MPPQPHTREHLFRGARRATAYLPPWLTHSSRRAQEQRLEWYRYLCSGAVPNLTGGRIKALMDTADRLGCYEPSVLIERQDVQANCPDVQSSLPAGQGIPEASSSERGCQSPAPTAAVWAAADEPDRLAAERLEKSVNEPAGLAPAPLFSWCLESGWGGPSSNGADATTAASHVN